MTFNVGDRVTTNAAYIAAGGPRAARKPFSGQVVGLYKDGAIRVVKDGTKSPQRMKAEWFDREVA